MVYRELGKTGMSASIIGLGAEHLDNKPYSVVEEVIHAALEQEINIIDVFMPGKEVRGFIGKALGTNRNKVMIQGHIGSCDLNEQYDRSRDLDVCKRYFDDLLTQLNTDHIELGMMFFIDTKSDFHGVFDTPYIKYVQQLKREGMIQAIGFSSHNPETAMKVIETGVAEMMMFSINPAFDLTPSDQYVFDTFDDNFNKQTYESFDPKRIELYNECQRGNIGITVMKTFGAGKLLSKEHTPFGRPMTSGQCIHYALNRPAVASVLLGCRSRQEVLDSVNYLNLTDEEKDYAPIIQTYKKDFMGNCLYCSHCQPCPVQIDIAAVNKYLDIALIDEGNIPKSIVSHYKTLERHGSDCTGCKQCEERCPFAVPVAKNMKRAEELFGL